MMKFFAPISVLFGLVSLTDPQGHKVWVSNNDVVSIVRPVDCDPRAGAKVTMTNGFICVQENPEEILRRLEELPSR